jgi:hypothetical protein
MKTNGLVRRWGFLTCLLMLAAGSVSASALYKPGDIVTNFTLINRLPWTNASGQYFDHGMPLRLTDLGGSVVFMEFFDAT